MALNGSTSIAVSSHNTLVFRWERSSYSIEENYSVVSWSLKLTSDAYGAIYSSASKSWSVNVNGTPYSGSNTVGINNSSTLTLASGSTKISHNADGTKTFSYSFSQYFGITFSGATIGTKSGNGSGTLDSIARKANLSAAPNFTDEGNPTITYSNPAGNSVTSLDACISLTGAKDDISYRAISKTGTSYTFELTDAEREILRNATTTANSRTVKFYVRTIIGGNTFYSILDKTLSIINATPTFTSSVKDNGAASTALTGSTAGNVSMIKGFNYMSCSMAATAYKGATISKYKISNGANAVEAAAADFNNAESNIFKFEVWDSRGNYNTYTHTISMIDYIPLTCNVDGKILLSTSDSTKANVIFTVQGNFFKGSFGAVSNILELEYTLADTDGNTINRDFVDITAQANNGTYNIEFTIDDLDYRNSYVVYVAAADAIRDAQASSKTLKAVPVFDWGENDFNFNVPVTIEGSLLDYVVSQGNSNGWNYRVWKSGLAECWFITEPTDFTVNTNWGGWYVKDNAFPAYKFPFEFEEIPSTVITPTATSGNFWTYTNSGSGNSTTETQAIGVMRPTQYDITGARLSYQVKGVFKKWI